MSSKGVLREREPLPRLEPLFRRRGGPRLRRVLQRLNVSPALLHAARLCRVGLTLLQDSSFFPALEHLGVTMFKSYVTVYQNHPINMKSNNRVARRDDVDLAISK